MENVGTDLATLQTAIAGNLFELGDLYACRLQDMALPEDFVAAHPGPAFGIEGPQTHQRSGRHGRHHRQAQRRTLNSDSWYATWRWPPST